MTHALSPVSMILLLPFMELKHFWQYVILIFIQVKSTQVLLADEPVSTRKVMLSVLDPSKVTTTTLSALTMMMMMMLQVEHKTQYVIKKAGGNVTLDCTDFTGEQEAAWRKIGGQSSLGLD